MEVEEIPWPEDFHPVPVPIRYRQGATPDARRIRVTAKLEGEEITLENNVAEAHWR